MKKMMMLLFVMALPMSLTACSAGDVVTAILSSELSKEAEGNAAGEAVLDAEESAAEKAVLEAEESAAEKAVLEAEDNAAEKAVLEAEESAAGEAVSEADTETAAEEERKAFSRAPEEMWDISAEIVAIVPVNGIYIQRDLTYGKTYEELICKCATAAGETVWLYLSSEDYTACFNPDAQIASVQFAYSDMAVFDVPIHIDGTVTETDTILDNLAETVGSDTVIWFGNSEKTTENIEESAYTADTKAMTSVNAEIVSIVPGYTLNNGISAESTDVVCRCETTDGSTIWTAMPVKTYYEQFDSEASLTFSGLASFEPVVYDPALTIHGIAIPAVDVASGLSEAIGGDTVLYFSRKD